MSGNVIRISKVFSEGNLEILLLWTVVVVVAEAMVLLLWFQGDDVICAGRIRRFGCVDDVDDVDDGNGGNDSSIAGFVVAVIVAAAKNCWEDSCTMVDTIWYNDDDDDDDDDVVVMEFVGSFCFHHSSNAFESNMDINSFTVIIILLLSLILYYYIVIRMYVLIILVDTLYKNNIVYYSIILIFYHHILVRYGRQQGNLYLFYFLKQHNNKMTRCLLLWYGTLSNSREVSTS